MGNRLIFLYLSIYCEERDGEGYISRATVSVLSTHVGGRFEVNPVPFNAEV